MSEEVKIEISSNIESPEPMKTMITWLYENREVVARLHNGWKPFSLSEPVNIGSAYDIWQSKTCQTSNGRGSQYHVTFKDRYGFAKWVLQFGPGPWKCKE